MNKDNLVEMYLDNVWRPNLAITGASGLPHYENAGNFLRPSTTIRASLRLAPDMDCELAKQKLVNLIEKDTPYNAKVTILNTHQGNGFCMKVLEPWLKKAIAKAGQDFWGKPSGSFGDGGSIPFLNELS